MPWKNTEPMEQRIEFALKAMRTLNFRALCQEYGDSAQTGYKWKQRLLQEGTEWMAEESRRPKTSPEQPPEEAGGEIEGWKVGHLPRGRRQSRAARWRRHG